ncbi:hypothetical protein Mapa_004858 [Marchantia paleacea]|nr:hypothetical protein Mapa_004858 [Marchantia paleacea]
MEAGVHDHRIWSRFFAREMPDDPFPVLWILQGVQTKVPLVHVVVSIKYHANVKSLIRSAWVYKPFLKLSRKLEVWQGAPVGDGHSEHEEHQVSYGVLEVGVAPEEQPLPAHAVPCFLRFEDVEATMSRVDPRVAFQSRHSASAPRVRARVVVQRNAGRKSPLLIGRAGVVDPSSRPPALPFLSRKAFRFRSAAFRFM